MPRVPGEPKTVRAPPASRPRLGPQLGPGSPGSAGARARGSCHRSAIKARTPPTAPLTQGVPRCSPVQATPQVPVLSCPPRTSPAPAGCQLSPGRELTGFYEDSAGVGSHPRGAEPQLPERIPPLILKPGPPAPQDLEARASSSGQGSRIPAVEAPAPSSPRAQHPPHPAAPEPQGPLGQPKPKLPPGGQSFTLLIPGFFKDHMPFGTFFSRLRGDVGMPVTRGPCTLPPPVHPPVHPPMHPPMHPPTHPPTPPSPSPPRHPPPHPPSLHAPPLHPTLSRVLRAAVLAGGGAPLQTPPASPGDFPRLPHRPPGALCREEKPEKQDRVGFICLPVLEAQGPGGWAPPRRGLGVPGPPPTRPRSSPCALTSGICRRRRAP
ncbi:hypothetical protein VULLAG_LOCUS16452 [Vulpes lagopus]